MAFQPTLPQTGIAQLLGETTFYWYGGTGNWSDYTNHWSNNSGNSPNSPKANAPTSSDDVFIDSNSGFGGGGTISTTGSDGANCKDFISTSGYSFTISGNINLSIYGSLTFEGGITTALSAIELLANIAGKTITIGGATIGNDIQIRGTGTWTLQDNLVLTGEFYLENGTFDANDHNVTANDFYFYADTDYTPTVIMGSGTWEATGNDDKLEPWYVEQYSDEVVTFTPETSTIKFSDESGYSKTFYFYDDTANEIGKTYNNLWLTGAGTGAFKIYGSNTFNDIKLDIPPHTLKFEDGTTQIVSTWTVSGTNGNLITINSQGGTIVTWTVSTAGTGYSVSEDVVVVEETKGAISYFTVASIDGSGGITGLTKTNGGLDFAVNDVCTVYGGNSDARITVNSISIAQHTLSKPSGVVSCDYLDISNSNAGGGATWYAGSHSVDTTNNDGWIFTAPPSGVKTLAALGVG